MTTEQASARQAAYAAFSAAVQEEERLRIAVKDRGPGKPDYDPRLWTEYMAALERTTITARELGNLTS